MTEAVTLTNALEDIVVDASMMPVVNVLTVVLGIKVDASKVDKTATVVFTLGVTYSNVGKVEDTAFISTLDVVLLNGTTDGFNALKHTSLAWTGSPKQVSVMYANNEPTVRPVVYDRVIILPASSRCPSGTLVGACIIGTEPTIPFVTPSKQENSNGYPSPERIGAPLGRAQSKNKGISMTRALEKYNNCDRFQSYGIKASSLPSTSEALNAAISITGIHDPTLQEITSDMIPGYKQSVTKYAIPILAMYGNIILATSILANKPLLISGHGLLVCVPYVPLITTTSSTLYVGPALPGGFPEGALGSYTGLLNENAEY